MNDREKWREMLAAHDDDDDDQSYKNTFVLPMDEKLMGKNDKNHKDLSV